MDYQQSSDHFDFSFVKLKENRAWQKYIKVVENIDDTKFHEVNRVIMFSGGLDSLAGALETAEKEGRLILVSNRPNIEENRRIKELTDQLGDKCKVPIKHIPVLVNNTGFKQESTQRICAFLLSALGATVASVFNAGGVCFFTNGVTSINLPLSPEVLRYRASKATHPVSLRMLQELYQMVLERTDFIIDNPYISKTKTEVASIIRENKVGDMIGNSYSCINSTNEIHCGLCEKCIGRRIAMLAADIDFDDNYLSDVFTGARPLTRNRPYIHNIAVAYARFANDWKDISIDKRSGENNLELSRAARAFPNPSEVVQEFIEMHRRYAADVSRVLDSQMKINSHYFVGGGLEKTSLLAMIGRGEHLELISQLPDIYREGRISPFELSEKQEKDYKDHI